jgi:hypothetical protein
MVEAKQNPIGSSERMSDTLKGLCVSAFLFAAAACRGKSTTSPSPPPVPQTFI